MRHRGLVVLATAVALAGAACSGATTSAGGGSSGSSCDLPLGDVDEDDRDGAIVVLVDGTLSVEGAGETGRVTDLVALLDESTHDAQLDVSIGSFGGSDAEVRFSQCLDGTTFVARGNNARTASAIARRCSRRPRRRSPRSRPATRRATQPRPFERASIVSLRVKEPEAWSSIPTAFRPPAVRRCPRRPTCPIRSLIDQLVANCVAAAQLPDAEGVEIVIGGIGRTDQDLSAESVTFLIDLNQALCDATGAACRVDPNLPPHL